MEGIPTWAQAFASSTVVLGVFGWFVRRAVNDVDKKLEKIDDLEETKADKSTLAELVARMEKRDDLFFEKLDKMAGDVTQTRIDLARSNGNGISK